MAYSCLQLCHLRLSHSTCTYNVVEISNALKQVSSIHGHVFFSVVFALAVPIVLVVAPFITRMVNKIA
jgi:hypothetical protein